MQAAKKTRHRIIPQKGEMYEPVSGTREGNKQTPSPLGDGDGMHLPGRSS